jgi:hypothetical protein
VEVGEPEKTFSLVLVLSNSKLYPLRFETRMSSIEDSPKSFGVRVSPPTG